MKTAEPAFEMNFEKKKSVSAAPPNESIQNTVRLQPVLPAASNQPSRNPSSQSQKQSNNAAPAQKVEYVLGDDDEDEEFK